MKLLQFILGIIVTFASAYCSIFLFFFGMAKEDGMVIFLSLFFLGITYFFPKIADIKNNEYTHKTIKLIKKLMVEQKNPTSDSLVERVNLCLYGMLYSIDYYQSYYSNYNSLNEPSPAASK